MGQRDAAMAARARGGWISPVGVAQIPLLRRRIRTEPSRVAAEAHGIDTRCVNGRGTRLTGPTAGRA